MKNSIFLIFSLFLFMETAFSQTHYNDATFPFFDFNPPKSKSEWLKRRTELRKTILEIIG